MHIKHIFDAFNTTSIYLDDILNISKVYFDNMVSQIYSSVLLLNKANTSDSEAAFLNLHLSVSNDIVSTKIYDKRDDFDDYIFLSLFVLLEHLAMLLTSTLAINCYLGNFLNNTIGIINFAKPFLRCYYDLISKS